MPIKKTKQIKTAFMLILVMMILTGIIYPLTVTLVAQLFFPWKANGSLFQVNGDIIGSRFIGQSFSRDDYFWGRLSATTPFPYNAENSSGSNFGPSSVALANQTKKMVALLKKKDPKNQQLIPVDLVTSSASGLDPEISPLSAYYQISRIAKARHLTEEQLQSLIQRLQKRCTFRLLGEPRINVLELNLALDQLSPTKNSLRNKK